jgi:RimJ/RimL family protein N-acetyltransferase
MFKVFTTKDMKEHKGQALGFELQPTLRGTRLELRPLRADDFDALFTVASDPLIWEQHPESDRYKREIFQRYFDSAMECGGAFAVIDRGSGRMIGSTRYWNLNAAESEIEIGWTFLQREFWGGEHNGEMKKLMLDHAFKFVERVVLIVGATNLRSQRAVEKIGGRLWKKTLRLDRHGAPREDLVFVIHRASWLKKAAIV